MDFSKRAEREPQQRERRPDISGFVNLEGSLDTLLQPRRRGHALSRTRVERLVQLPLIEKIYQHYRGSVSAGIGDFGSFGPGWTGSLYPLSRERNDIHDTHAIGLMLRHDHEDGSSRGIMMEFQKPYELAVDVLTIEIVDSRLEESVSLTRRKIMMVFDHSHPKAYSLEATLPVTSSVRRR